MTDIGLTTITDQAPQHVDRDPIPNGDAGPRNTRFSAWTRSALRDMIYCGAGFAWSIAAFTILVTGIAVTASLLFLLVGVFAWIGFAHVLRWTTWVDRNLAGYGLARSNVDRRLPRGARRDHGLGSGRGLRIHAALVLGGLPSPVGVWN